jgi:engulfment/cell motility protein 1
VEISNITTIQATTSTAVNSRSQGTPSKLSFSFLSGPEMSLLDLDAVHSAQFSEWVDGVRVLKGEGGMRSLESGVYVKVSLQVKGSVVMLMCFRS